MVVEISLSGVFAWQGPGLTYITYFIAFSPLSRDGCSEIKTIHKLTEYH
jgi:hypothetical protein